jgi:hypothetical protein
MKIRSRVAEDPSPLDCRSPATRCSGHRPAIWTARRPPGGQHRHSRSSTFHRHEARRVWRRGNPCRAPGRRHLPMDSAALNPRPARTPLRRGGHLQEQALHGSEPQVCPGGRALDGALEDFRRVDGVVGARHARTVWNHRRTRARGQSQSRHRPRQHIRAVWRTRISRPSRLRRAPPKPLAA